MPNWCSTTYHVASDKKGDLKDLYNKMKSLEEMKEPLARNDFGNKWLGCLVLLLGGDPNKIYCRGFWGDVCLSIDGTGLSFYTETAWAEMTETRHFIESKYPGMKMYYMSEECGMAEYFTNDLEGKFFTSRFVVEYDGDNGEFETKAEAKASVEEIIGRSIPRYEDINKALQDWIEEQGNEDLYGSYYEYKLLDD